MTQHGQSAVPAYEKPIIRDLGNLRDLTEAFSAGDHRDVPLGAVTSALRLNVFS